MFKCKICNKEFKNSLALRGHSRIHSPKESARIKEKQQKYENHKDSISNIFLDNKYTKIYYKIIAKARKTTYSGYTEKHHVLPRSLGGENKNNLVKMSAREHYICHLLLTKMIKENTNEYFKILNAYIGMTTCNKNLHKRHDKKNSKLYQSLKEKYSKEKSKSMKENNSSYGTMWIVNFNKKENKKIKNEELENYEKLGWKKGRITNFELYDKNGNRIKNENYKKKRDKILKNDIDKKIINDGVHIPKRFTSLIKITKKILSLDSELVKFSDVDEMRKILISDIEEHDNNYNQVIMKRNISYSNPRILFSKTLYVTDANKNKCIKDLLNLQ